MTNQEATNYLLDHLTGACEPLEHGTEIRETDGQLVMTLPEEDAKGNVTFGDFVITVTRRQ